MDSWSYTWWCAIPAVSCKENALSIPGGEAYFSYFRNFSLAAGRGRFLPKHRKIYAPGKWLLRSCSKSERAVCGLAKATCLLHSASAHC
eukprot:5310949-Prymnesium_polylepis.1